MTDVVLVTDNTLSCPGPSPVDIQRRKDGAGRSAGGYRKIRQIPNADLLFGGTVLRRGRHVATVRHCLHR